MDGDCRLDERTPVVLLEVAGVLHAARQDGDVEHLQVGTEHVGLTGPLALVP